MSEEPPQPIPPDPKPDPKPPIEYRNYSDDRPERRKNITAFVTGMIPGIILVAIYGCGNYQMPIYPFPPRTAMNRQVPVFGCAAVIAGVVGAVFLRPPRRRFMLAGFLLGVALTCIIEGVCFFG